MRGRTNVGGGDNLNFKIVGGTTQPGASGDTLTWDGNTEGLEYVGEDAGDGTVMPLMYKLSDSTATIENFANGCSYTLLMGVGGQSINVEASAEELQAVAEEVGLVAANGLFFVPEDNFLLDFEGLQITIPTAGTWHLTPTFTGGVIVTSFTIPGYTGFGGSAAPKENTIWVNTDTEIAGWVFSATEPTGPVEGMVWIKTGYTSPAAFNAIKKNNVMVYPLGCYQYINGAWVKKTAKSYIGGEWKPWAQYLFDGGDECASVTGGWTASAIKPTSSHNTASKPTVTKTNADITVEITSGSGTGGGLFHTNNKIDITPYSTLYMSVTACKGQRKDLVVPDDLNAGWENDPKTRYTETAVPTIMSLDVSNINGYRYVAIGLAYNQAQTAAKVPVGVTTDKIWLE